MWYGMVENERVSILFMIWYGMGFLQMVKREGHASCGLSLCSPSMWGGEARGWWWIGKDENTGEDVDRRGLKWLKLAFK